MPAAIYPLLSRPQLIPLFLLSDLAAMKRSAEAPSAPEGSPLRQPDVPRPKAPTSSWDDAETSSCWIRRTSDECPDNGYTSALVNSWGAIKSQCCIVYLRYPFQLNATGVFWTPQSISESGSSPGSKRRGKIRFPRKAIPFIWLVLLWKHCRLIAVEWELHRMSYVANIGLKEDNVTGIVRNESYWSVVFLT